MSYFHSCTSIFGRFINADAFIPTGQGILGNNMFAYCGNSPVDHVDATGQYYCKVILNSFMPIDTGLVNVTGGAGGASAISGTYGKSYASQGTISSGVSLNVAFGVALSVSLGTTYDEAGNYGIILTVGFGGGSPSAGVSKFISKNNAPTIFDQEGWGSPLEDLYHL